MVDSMNHYLECPHLGKAAAAAAIASRAAATMKEFMDDKLFWKEDKEMAIAALGLWPPSPLRAAKTCLVYHTRARSSVELKEND